jgi:hypothetical protein
LHGKVRPLAKRALAARLAQVQARKTALQTASRRVGALTNPQFPATEIRLKKIALFLGNTLTSFDFIVFFTA